jgi:putative oxidoreductase
MNTIDIGILILRLAVGLTFAAHGVQKAFGWWSGPGPAGWHAAMTKMGMEPAGLWAAVSTGVELIGGLMFAIGLLTPLAAAALVAQSAVIILKVHLPNGFFNSKGGIEFPLSLGAVALAILVMGAGSISADAALGFVLAPSARAVLLVLAVAGAVVALATPSLRTLGHPRSPLPR